MQITHHNPESMHRNPAFSQAVSVEGQRRIIYVGGQNGITADGKLAGADLGTQTEQALRNVIEALKSAGAMQEHVVKMSVHVVHGQDINVGFAASQKVWGAQPTAITVLVVAGLGLPGALVEIDAVAAV